ncbi:MAG: hypothetical protein DRJ10_06160 [Bacteroidetes bacterium]|nr:MAG: hypothetical protein DRJ10_06160 [Bacteroidota bacterium]
MIKTTFLSIVIFLNLSIIQAQQNSLRWNINDQGGITWTINEQIPHYDHIEMSGKKMSVVVAYGVNADGTFSIKRDLVWPMLRTIPNNTHASLMHEFTDNTINSLKINGFAAKEIVTNISLNGTIVVNSKIGNGVQLERIIFPATDKPVYCEKYLLSNTSSSSVSIKIPELSKVTVTEKKKGVYGAYTLTYKTTGYGTFTVAPGKSKEFDLTIIGIKNGEDFSEIDIDAELEKRKAFINQIWDRLILETPDTVLNSTFAFAKIRASESIYETKGGPMHGPGGLSYYAAIWANDQAEYVNPFFPYLGYDYANKSAINSYEWFAKFMNDDYIRIPSSIIAEGDDIWQGAGDRGDAAMIAYGAARFVMSYGDKATAEKLWPLIEWCLEYNHRKLNEQGVVASKTDELEGRFPTGKANLCTSSLYYDALLSSAWLGKSLGKDEKLLDAYLKKAEYLKGNIDTYFGANVMGFDTYRYYKKNKKLRAWICIPLTMGIYDRKEATINALFSPELWTDDGLATVSGDKTFWDRATLYGLRGVLAAGDTKRGIEYLKKYSERRLLGDHVPYPVEAYPEGGQKHLSAESGLYARIITEGLFGIRPTGLKSFNLTPQLPLGWDKMSLRKIHGFGDLFDIEITKTNKGIKVRILKEGNVFKEFEIASGKTVAINIYT